MKIIDLYRSILNCGGLTSNDDGYISVKFDKKASPVLIGGKRLVLPTQKQLTGTDWAEKVIFHPLSENILRGESEVISKMRSVFNIRLNYTFAAIAQNLLTIIASTQEHKKLTPTQSELLSAVVDADETTLIAFTKMMVNSIQESPDKAFINIFLKRGGMIGGKKYARVGVIKFPLYEELQKKQDSYYGVTLSNKSRNALLNLYKYIFPNLDDAEAYNYGSDSNVAPFLDALMGSVLGIASKLNDVLSMFEEQIDDSKELVFDDEWVETFENLPSLISQIRMIPTQAGNEGTIKANELTPVQPVQIPVQQPLQQFQQPVYQQQPQQPFQQPMVQQTQQPQQPGLVITEGGIDFNSLIRTNPQIAASAMFSGFQQPVYQQQQLTPPPRWAQPQYQQPMQQFPNTQVFGNAFSNIV